jgi:hypothetical protein
LKIRSKRARKSWACFTLGAGTVRISVYGLGG